jgi:anaerobic selenocysteine-containing dehydrogenase
METVRISRRNFLKLNAIIGSALAVTVALPAAAVVAASAASSTAPGVEDILTHTPTVRFGTPTDVAVTWAGDAWSVDAEGIMRRFDRAHHTWLRDGDGTDDEADFPVGSQLVLARWGRPSGPNQMLMVLAGFNLIQ